MAFCISAAMPSVRESPGRCLQVGSPVSAAKVTRPRWDTLKRFGVECSVMGGVNSGGDNCSAWNPGIGTGIPAEFRLLETIHCPGCVFGDPDQVGEFASLTGLPQEELAAFRPTRLVLHELILRITADIAVAEGEAEEDFGRNFRRIAGKVMDDYIAPRLDAIVRDFEAMQGHAEALVRKIIVETLFAPPPSAPARRFPFGLWRKAKPAIDNESPAEHDHRVISGYKAAGLLATDMLERSVYRGLYRVLGAIAGKRGGVGPDRDLLVAMVTRHVCNNHGSRLVGQAIAPLVDAAIDKEGYARAIDREAPVLISLKGASAAGKSSLRPMLKKLMRENGIEPDGYATISPDIWRRMLIDYDSLGPAYKYAGHFTSRELMVIDGKLDRYIREKAGRAQAIPHLLVDRFRFDSFSGEQVARVLHDTYAKYVATMYMYFVVTPPEETVERGWQRALERGRYKAVEDFLGHCVEAYAGMPKLLFKWLAYRDFDYRYFFLDNRVPKGTFPKPIALGNRLEMTIHDPVPFIDIRRYERINVHARSRAEVYPRGDTLDIASDSSFLKECIRRIDTVTFVDGEGSRAYLRARQGRFEVLDASTLTNVLRDDRIAAIIREIAPGVAP